MGPENVKTSRIFVGPGPTDRRFSHSLWDVVRLSKYGIIKELFQVGLGVPVLASGIGFALVNIEYLQAKSLMAFWQISAALRITIFDRKVARMCLQAL